MAVVGEAFVVVKALTAGAQRSINELGNQSRAGSMAGKSFSSGFNKSRGSLRDLFTPQQRKSFADIGKQSDKTLERFNDLTRAGYVLGTSVGVLASSLSSLVGGLVSLVGAVGSAAPALAALGGGFAAVAIGGITAKLALGGVGAAVSALNKKSQASNVAANTKAQQLLKITQDLQRKNQDLDKKELGLKKELTLAQTEYNKAINQAQEEIQQLNFDVEDAAIGEKKAAIELEKAKEALARVQDLPPNSRARREAMLAYQEADLNLRQAKDRNSDLRKEQDRLSKEGVAGTQVYVSALAKKTDAEQALLDLTDERTRAQADALAAEAKVKNSKTPGVSVADPLAGLTDSQKTFAKFLSGLKPQLDSLKEAAASGFLPILQTSIQSIVDNAFPTFKDGLRNVGTALGTASQQIADSITKSENLVKLKEVFKTSADVINSLGGTVGNVWDSALSILVAADPITRKFFDFIEAKTGKFAAMLSTKEADGSLTDFFNTAGDIAAEIGTIFSNTFGTIGNIIKANTGPGSGGQILLDYLKGITAGWKEATGGKNAQNAKKFFSDVGENAKAILEAVGAFSKEFIKLGGDPNTKKFWETIGTAAPAFGQILTNLNKGGPAFADLLVTVADIVAVLSETGGVNVFFDTLNSAAKILLKILRDPDVKKIIGFTSKLHGFFLAVGTLWLATGAGARVLIGSIRKIVKVFMVLQKYGRSLIFIMRVLFVTNPVGLLVTAIVALVAIFVLLFKKNKKFHDFVIKMWNAIKDAALKVYNFLKNIFAKVWGFIGGALSTAWNAIKIIWKLIVTGIKVYIATITKIGKTIWGWLSKGLSTAWNAVKLVWKLIKTGIKLYIAGIVKIGKTIWGWLSGPLEKAWNFVVTLWDTNKAIIKAAIETIIGLGEKIWNWLSDGISKAWDKVTGYWNNTIVPFFTGIGDAIAKYASAAWNWFSNGISNAWDKVTGFWNVTVVPFFTGIGKSIATAAGNVWSWITDKLSDVWNGAKNIFNTIITFVTGIKDKIVKAAAGMWDGLKNGLETVVNFVIRGVNLIIKGINLLIKAANAVKIGDDIKEIKEILPVKFAKGGIVPSSPGGTLAMIGEAGRSERVEPLDPDGLSKRDKAMIQLLAGGSGGNTFNIYPSPGMNETELASIVSRQIAFQLRRGGA